MPEGNQITYSERMSRVKRWWKLFDAGRLDAHWSALLLAEIKELDLGHLLRFFKV